GDDIAGVVDDEGVVAHAALHGIGALPAVERVVAEVAAERVVAVVAAELVGAGLAFEQVRVVVAGGVDGGCAEQLHVLDHAGISGQIQVDRDRRLDGVGAVAVDDDVLDVVDQIGVAAGVTGHSVGADAAVERVVEGAAAQGVGAAARRNLVGDGEIG